MLGTNAAGVIGSAGCYVSIWNTTILHAQGIVALSWNGKKMRLEIYSLN